MKKRLFLTFIATAAIVLTAGAKSRVITNTEDGKWQVISGDVTMVIDANAGGKIMSYQKNGKEMIHQSRVPNQFGSTFWTSPQKEWNWPPVPEIDSRPYTADQELYAKSKGKVLTMTSGVSERYPYQITKQFKPEKKGIIKVTYSVKNMDTKERSIAPWEITRVPGDGVIFFDAPVEGITPAGLIPFKPQYGIAWYQYDTARQNRKINADGKGWLAYVNDGLMLVKMFPDLDASQPAPDEAEIQVYVNSGKTYIELESQGAYTTLQPGESVSWTVRWAIAETTAQEEPSEQLLKEVRKIVK